MHRPVPVAVRKHPRRSVRALELLPIIYGTTHGTADTRIPAHAPHKNEPTDQQSCVPSRPLQLATEMPGGERQPYQRCEQDRSAAVTEAEYPGRLCNSLV